MNLIHWRLVGPVLLIVGVIFCVSISIAISLFSQQTSISRLLRENVSSRSAASELRGTLNTLMALETNRIEDVSDLHSRAEAELVEIESFANYPDEQAISKRLREGFNSYIQSWKSLSPKDSPSHRTELVTITKQLELGVIFPCREIENLNDFRIKQTVAEHEHFLSQLAWGMGVVGILVAISGVVLGFGVARLFAKSMRKLHIHIQDTAGKLGPAGPSIEISDEMDFVGLHEELELLSQRIESMVQELKAREQEILRSEQLAAVGQLAAGVGHELRNPLTSIKILIQAGMEETPPQITIEDLQIIEAEVRRMERSLQSFLDFTRPPRLERRTVLLSKILNDVIALVRGRAEQQKVQIFVSVPEYLSLNADPVQLQQVFVNIVLNALDVMPLGGILQLTAHQRNRMIDIKFHDSGPGISSEMIQRLFMPFASSKETGLGLGLVISRRIVEDHGGSITAANDISGGAVFVVQIPNWPHPAFGESTRADTPRN
ncbi:sensor histidine kinase [Tuwongella immobilis]|uniref:histidine kinase n=1 Tax=Tuwongella immobilis TaxID=692036 RepID=A0A6C2YNQ1_9BACT|nr:HAMP domain-containing sensor histidine kinase [Tuwongella immobilis]VIP02997.1 histidine kinase : Histidine kinase OS=Singulisphaera acidiphila (strain ATCC BAA-1392 / DSM 18658 / VKM B-2454 / MOB10) GN=Sinac_0783 PE=4 SV=1: HisKA: HATPase_c [Tuwongella immobilis]VTS03079.1 histidine kinase : Histidine kinase OS=Singulisphaera acidiphila (strain ATCC BAA-1392 / DSM 18658 / VKM B-2454 / MOB10) GN=Sinac_0783 PE=4 SV=1: HisKA: HATPase_c [Tuwongella immobilis]